MQPQERPYGLDDRRPQQLPQRFLAGSESPRFWRFRMVLAGFRLSHRRDRIGDGNYADPALKDGWNGIPSGSLA